MSGGGHHYDGRSPVRFLPEEGVDDRNGKMRAKNVTGGCQEQKPGTQPPTDPGGKNGSGKETGVVARWNGQRGFGFIKPNSGGEDIFCHVSSIVDGNALPEGEEVTYDQGTDDRSGKVRAQNVAGGFQEETVLFVFAYDLYSPRHTRRITKTYTRPARHQLASRLFDVLGTHGPILGESGGL